MDFTVVASAKVIVMLSQLEVDLAQKLELCDLPHGFCI